jgi:hypothetical protein
MRIESRLLMKRKYGGRYDNTTTRAARANAGRSAQPSLRGEDLAPSAPIADSPDGYDRADYWEAGYRHHQCLEDINPCHCHFKQRVEEVKRGIWEAGGFRGAAGHDTVGGVSKAFTMIPNLPAWTEEILVLSADGKL